MVRMPLKRARATFFSKKHGFLGLTPVYSETTALNKPYFKLKLWSVRKFRRKHLFFNTQNVAATCYYCIEDPFPDVISKLRRFGIRSAAWWLSRAIGSQNAVVLMLRKLLLLEGSWGKYVIPYFLAQYTKITLAFLLCS